MTDQVIRYWTSVCQEIRFVYAIQVFWCLDVL